MAENGAELIAAELAAHGLVGAEEARRELITNHGDSPRG